MIVEPFANDGVEDNLNPVGRVFYSASTFICTPTSLSQEVGAGSARRRARPGCARSRRARVHPVPPRDGDAVQPDLRGSAVTGLVLACETPGASPASFLNGTSVSAG